MSCAESVLKRMDADIRQKYSASLFSLATGRKKIAGIPLTFGEGDTKSRIKNVLNYKKPAFWIVALAIIVCIIVLAVCLIANPRTPSAEEPADILGIVLDAALLEAKKIETIGGIDIKGLIFRDTAYLLQTIEPNVCEVIFPVEGYDYSIGVTFTRENEQGGWKLLPVNAANVYDPGRWTEPTGTDISHPPAPVIQEIMKKIDNREIIDEAHFSSISSDPELAVMLKEYNEQTRAYYDFFHDMATRTIDFVFDEWDFNPEARPHYPVSTEVFDEMVARIVVNSLYSDCTQRFLDDPLLAPIIEKEAGGSAGRWPYVWHTEYLDHIPKMKTALAEYFDLVESMIRRLKEVSYESRYIDS